MWSTLNFINAICLLKPLKSSGQYLEGLAELHNPEFPCDYERNKNMNIYM